MSHALEGCVQWPAGWSSCTFARQGGRRKTVGVGIHGKCAMGTRPTIKPQREAARTDEIIRCLQGNICQEPRRAPLCLGPPFDTSRGPRRGPPPSKMAAHPVASPHRAPGVDDGTQVPDEAVVARATPTNAPGFPDGSPFPRKPHVSSRAGGWSAESAWTARRLASLARREPACPGALPQRSARGNCAKREGSRANAQGPHRSTVNELVTKSQRSAHVHAPRCINYWGRQQGNTAERRPQAKNSDWHSMPSAL